MAADLKTIKLFEGLQESDLRQLSGRAAVRSLPAGAVVVREGEPADALYLIARGKVKVHLGEGSEEVLLDTKGPGQYFGEMMLDDKPRSATVTTLEPCEMATISGADFKAFLLAHPEVSLQLIRNLIQMARGQNVRTRDDVRTREQLRQYIAQLKTTRPQDLPEVKRWTAVKHWALVALLIIAALVYYFADVFVDMLQIQGVSVFIK